MYLEGNGEFYNELVRWFRQGVKFLFQVKLQYRNSSRWKARSENHQWSTDSNAFKKKKRKQDLRLIYSFSVCTVFRKQKLNPYVPCSLNFRIALLSFLQPSNIFSDPARNQGKREKKEKSARREKVKGRMKRRSNASSRWETRLASGISRVWKSARLNGGVRLVVVFVS